jgi:cytochrome c oxidase subunit II
MASATLHSWAAQNAPRCFLARLLVNGLLTLPLLLPNFASAAYNFNFPEPVTPIARETLHIHNEFMLIITIMFVVVFAIMIYSMIKHRKSVGHQASKFTGPASALQWLWALIPFAILLFIDFVLMGVPAVKAIINMEDTQTRADMVLKVTGMQWKWQYEYPEAGVKFISTLATPRNQIANNETKGEHYLLEVDNPVVLPVGKKVRVLLTSTDVIHTWWVPQFGVKRDAVPGFLRETWVLIEKPGIYRGQCAELCGKDHGFMPVVVHAVPKPRRLPVAPTGPGARMNCSPKARKFTKRYAPPATRSMGRDSPPPSHRWRAARWSKHRYSRRKARWSRTAMSTAY